MNFSIESGYGLFGALAVVLLGVIVLLVVAGLFKTVFGGRKSIQDIEAEQIAHETVGLDEQPPRRPPEDPVV